MRRAHFRCLRQHAKGRRSGTAAAAAVLVRVGAQRVSGLVAEGERRCGRSGRDKRHAPWRLPTPRPCQRRRAAKSIRGGEGAPAPTRGVRVKSQASRLGARWRPGRRGAIARDDSEYSGSCGCPSRSCPSARQTETQTQRDPWTGSRRSSQTCTSACRKGVPPRLRHPNGAGVRYGSGQQRCEAAVSCERTALAVHQHPRGTPCMACACSCLYMAIKVEKCRKT
eukprot:350848-Chlamydomonas_euryale.AAC.7